MTNSTRYAVELGIKLDGVTQCAAEAVFSTLEAAVRFALYAKGKKATRILRRKDVDLYDVEPEELKRQRIIGATISPFDDEAGTHFNSTIDLY